MSSAPEDRQRGFVATPTTVNDVQSTVGMHRHQWLLDSTGQAHCLAIHTLYEQNNRYQSPGYEVHWLGTCDVTSGLLGSLLELCGDFFS